MKLNEPLEEVILCKDPFQTQDDAIERLMGSF
jgi:hypothetical protein